MRFKYLLFILLSAVMVSGCKKFLEVTPKSSLADTELFSSETGFQQALSGVYSQLAGRNLFGDNLSMGFVSALAQNYNLSTAAPLFAQTTALNFTSAEVVGYGNTIWSSAYQSIAGLNHFLGYTEKQRSVLTETNYRLLKGEALGLRAYLHFELLRLYGPAYLNAGAKKVIPYEKSADAFVNIPSTAEEVVNLALADLKDAETLMKAVDPVVLLAADPALSSVDSDRRFKMNFYALKALEARIRLFKGDNIGAAAAAKAVVDDQKFALMDPARMTSSANAKDRLFMSEVIFGLRNKNLKTWTETSYFKYGGSATNRLTRTEAQLKAIYESSTFDIRWVYLFEADQGVIFPSKFWQTNSFVSVEARRIDNTVPLIRLAEMYYILAETAGTPAIGAGYLNLVRKARSLAELNVNTVTEQSLRAELSKEYNKEFYAEGQTFYYYKRLGATRLPEQVNNVFGKTVTTQNYILPVPDLELEFNPNYK